VKHTNLKRKIILTCILVVAFILMFWFGTHVLTPLPDGYFSLFTNTNQPQTAIDFSQPTPPALNPAPTVTSVKLHQTAWIPDWDYAKGYASFTQNYQYFDSVSPVWYHLGKKGEVTSKIILPKQIREFTKANNIKLIPSIAGFNGDHLHQLLNNRQRLDNHIDFLLSQISKYDLDGIDLDYESFYMNDQPELLYLLSRLHAELDSQGKKLTFPVYPVWNDSKSLYWFKQTALTQDWYELNNYVHELRIMSYHQTGGTSKFPGPVSPSDWHDAILRHASVRVNPAKTVLGLGLYGHDGWSNSTNIPEPYLGSNANPGLPKAQANAVTYEKIQGLPLKHKVQEYLDEFSKEKVLRYRYEGKLYTVFFADVQSAINNARVAKRYNIYGMAYWRLGREDTRIYKIISEL
jgi:spore germination protein